MGLPVLRYFLILCQDELIAPLRVGTFRSVFSHALPHRACLNIGLRQLRPTLHPRHRFAKGKRNERSHKTEARLAVHVRHGRIFEASCCLNSFQRPAQSLPLNKKASSKTGSIDARFTNTEGSTKRNTYPPPQYPKRTFALPPKTRLCSRPTRGEFLVRRPSFSTTLGMSSRAVPLPLAISAGLLSSFTFKSSANEKHTRGLWGTRGRAISTQRPEPVG